MSTNQIQIRNTLELIAKAFFTGGVNPLTEQITALMSEFFSYNPAGLPITLDRDIFIQAFDSDPEMLNDFMALMIVNLDTLYAASAENVEQLMALNTVLRNHLDRLKVKRKMLEQRIDDFLLGIYNSDGYFYSFSDNFNGVSNIDFEYTSAFVDTTSGLIALPAISSISKLLDSDSLVDPNISIKDKNGNKVPFIVKSDFVNAVDGMTNTAWFVEVRLSEPKTLMAEIQIPLLDLRSVSNISKIEITPFGVTPVQCGVNSTVILANNARIVKPFANLIKTSAEKMVFVADQIDDVESVSIQMAKTDYDFAETDVSGKKYVYLFGMKELLVTEQYYDNVARFVSEPISIDDSIANETVIDAVSLVVEDYVPTNASLTYYVAADNEDATDLSDFNWQQIVPIGDLSGNNRIHFNGSFAQSKMVRKTPRSGSDLKLFEANTTSPDLTKRNPTAAYIQGYDVYRITEFTDTFLAGSLTLEEGINTTKIYYTELDDDSLSFSFWKEKFDSKDFSVAYGEIDSGHEFFYGADLAEDNKSFYAETFLVADKSYPIFLKECKKSDSNSKTWDIKVFLNGKEIANMPAGTDKLTVPWKINEGLNHIVVMGNIPESSTLYPYSYVGTFNIMVNDLLTNYGIVKLADWTYVDLYKFQNNQVNDAKTFTIYNNELISRRQPTNNFKLTFKTGSEVAPSAIRLRADFARSNNDARITPLLDSYRIRFSYK